MHDETSTGIVKVSSPKKADKRVIRLLICAGIFSMLLFVVWFVNPGHVGHPIIYSLLTFALLFKLVKMLHEWYHYWNVSIPQAPAVSREWSVDVFTTACPGEPVDMIVRTLRKMVAIKYPHTNYLCDEGNDPFLKKICDELGVIHVTRTEKVDAKAGNINNALQQAKGEICVVLDPDHEPVACFLDRVLPYFENPEIGFVQCVQAYSNQSESFIAKGAAEQTYHFYGPMMMCMNSYGTVQAIGANCTFRRSALDSIGGHAAGLSEDMHTAMQLHAKGWKSVYIPEILTRGLAPATLSSYYKQQLKWSRGTFELLFRTYPALYKSFTLRQKIHYFTIPLYFLFGFINLVDIIVPLLALCLSEVPWEVNLGKFALYFFPLCCFSLLIRMYAQRWLLEKHERGFHLAGGILRTATWWVFLIGFVYTIFNIKVPYIPTPKEDERENYWNLSVPNIIVLLLSFLTVFYGLYKDWTPYSFAMASYALINAGMLGIVVVISQQRLLDSVYLKVKQVPYMQSVVAGGNQLALKAEQLVYRMFRIGPVALLLASSLLFFNYSNLDEDSELSMATRPKEIGGFYTGFYCAEHTEVNRNTNNFNSLSGNRSNIISMDCGWDTCNTSILTEMLSSVDTTGGILLLNWIPDTPDSSAIFKKIKQGKFDSYLEKCAEAFREHANPVFLNFAPAFDDTGNGWSITGDEFVKGWQYVYTFFNDLGVSNLTWVWSPKYGTSKTSYPGPKFVDWIGCSCLNYGDNTRDNDWYTFKQIYSPFRKNLGSFHKPVVIYEFGTVSGNDQPVWYKHALTGIGEDFKEIRALVFYNHTRSFNITRRGERSITYTANFAVDNPLAVAAVKESLEKEPFTAEPFLSYEVAAYEKPAKDYKSGFIHGASPNFSLVISSKPYYVQGVAYNTAHDWRDGNMPLTRKQVEKDFEKIKAMGANTIRRYDHGVYDRNVLNIASEYDLKVLYGFWFDPKIDYYKDTVKVQEYMNNVIEKVRQFKEHNSILAWSLGNETWGQLKHRYAKPYLTKVRQCYVKMIETIAQRIHFVDSIHPIFSCMEHEEYQLPGELVAFRDGAPSIDVIGINSYYREQISKLNHIAWQFDSVRPYLVSEFGPRGYWDPKYNRVKNGALDEESDVEKARWYTEQWSTYIFPHKGYNVGGFAYCWHDRMEGSYTWFGLTDFKGRPKASYFALKKIWSHGHDELPVQFTIDAPAEIFPGKTYQYRAVALSQTGGGLTYEWFLHKNGYLERVNNIEYGENEPCMLLKIPSEPSEYRLYLYVSDRHGKVSTVSMPVTVAKK